MFKKTIVSTQPGVVVIDELVEVPTYDFNLMSQWTVADWEYIFLQMLLNPITYVNYDEIDGPHGMYSMNHFEDAEIQFVNKLCFTGVTYSNGLIMTELLLREDSNGLSPLVAQLVYADWHNWIGYEILRRVAAPEYAGVVSSVAVSELLQAQVKLALSHGQHNNRYRIKEYADEFWCTKHPRYREAWYEDCITNRLNQLGPLWGNEQ